MHHYFTNRMALVAVVIEHIFYRRLDHFLSEYFEAVRKRSGQNVVAIAAETHWHNVQTRDYAAYIELAIAAHMGLLFHRPVFGAGERTAAVRNLISKVAQSLYHDD